MKVCEEDEDDEDDVESSARLLVLTHGDDCEVWHVDTVVEKHGTGPLRPEVKYLSLKTTKLCLDLINFVQP